MLWLNAPVGYPYAEQISKDDYDGLKRFMLQLAGADQDMQEIVRNATHPQIIKMLEDSKFTFDEQWYGYRALPERPDGVQRSALDDPEYRARLGIIDRPPLWLERWPKIKLPCYIHGAHFGDEIDDIVACDYVWGAWNLKELPEDSRRDLAEWVVQIPADKVYLDTGWGCSIELLGYYFGPEKNLARSPEYEAMSETERRDLQRQVIKEEYDRQFSFKKEKKRRRLWKR